MATKFNIELNLFFLGINDVELHVNHDLKDIYTPIDADKLEKLLKETGYPEDETKELVNGFRFGFDLGYRSSRKKEMKAKNLRFTVGNEKELWRKVMSEVKEKRYAGPYSQIPFKTDYIQSPIGLVPKDKGQKTRLIFHLSYPRGEGTSVNACTLPELTHVNYADFDQAVRLCLKNGVNCKIGKSDLSAAFRRLPIKPKFWRYLIMKAKNPTDHKFYYFIDKCLPFGASISCALFQKFSDALSHIIKVKNDNKDNINYLDDFFFADFCTQLCRKQLQTFIDVCSEIRFPISSEKTEWPTNKLTFLGLILDTLRQKIYIPEEKVIEILKLIQCYLNKKKRKITLKQLQCLCGHLNFVCKAVVPGRAFTRRLYARGDNLTNPNHHLKITKEMENDLMVWVIFLKMQENWARPFFHFDLLPSVERFFYTDASTSFGCGGVCENEWFILEWSEDWSKLIQDKIISINYLELYALTIGIFLWLKNYRNSKTTVFCDNQAVVAMINSTSSPIKNNMVLIRQIVLLCMKENMQLTAKYIPSKQNIYADLLPRGDYLGFCRHARSQKHHFKGKMVEIPEHLADMDDLV